MKRFAYANMLKNAPDIIRKYEEYHANIWSEVREANAARGIRRANIYRCGRLLFMFLETTDDFNPDNVEEYLSSPKVRE